MTKERILKVFDQLERDALDEIERLNELLAVEDDYTVLQNLSQERDEAEDWLEEVWSLKKLCASFNDAQEILEVLEDEHNSRFESGWTVGADVALAVLDALYND